MGQDTNTAERRRWNDPAWVSSWEGRERITACVTPVVLEHLRLTEGEAVLDIGSGGGGLARQAALAVGPIGRVTGVDISEPFLDRAQARCRDAGIDNVRFVLADAQTVHLSDPPFDVATSQFGVMFFDDPVAAFANIGRHLTADGRLAFVCWQGFEENRWCLAPTLAPFQSTPCGAGPAKAFSFGDPDNVTAVLAAAGWNEVERHVYQRREVVDRAALIDDLHVLDPVGESDRPQAKSALEEHLGQFQRADGRYDIVLAFQIFCAHLA